MAKIPTVTLCLRKKIASDNYGYIKIKVGVPGANREKFKTTGYKIAEKYWDDNKKEVTKGALNYANINREIEKEKAEVIATFEAAMAKKITFTAAYISQALKPKQVSGEFMQFYLDYIVYLKTKFSPGYTKHFTTEYNTLKRHAGDGVMYSDITTKFLQGFEMSMAKKAKTTVNTKMKRLKEVINHAIALRHITTDQVTGYKFPAYSAPHKGYLTMEQTEKIGDMIYKGELDGNPEFKVICCYFLIECYAGIRFGDWNNFEVETLITDRNFKCRANKNGEPVYLPLDRFKRLARILDYVAAHNLKATFAIQTTNVYLKSLGVLLGLKFPLTSHYGRRTCGTLLGEAGYSTRAIAEVLGITEDTAKTYVKNTRQGLNFEVEKYGGL